MPTPGRMSQEKGTAMAIAAPFPAAAGTSRRPSAPAARRPSARTARRLSHGAPGIGRARTSSWRLTRRGRIVVGVVLSVPFAAALMMVGSVQADAETTAADRPATAVVVVQPGESLWGIAQQIAPGADPREVVTSIRDLNGLGDTPVVPGQSLVVPSFDR